MTTLRKVMECFTHRLTRTLRWFSIFIVLSSASFAFNYDDWLAWVSRLEKEFDEQIFKDTVSGSNLDQRLKVLLYSDDFFVPFYGRPFDRIGSTDRARLAQKVTDYSLKYSRKMQTRFASWIHNAGMSPLAFDHEARQVLANLVILREKEAEFENSIAEMRSGSGDLALSRVEFDPSAAQRSRSFLPPSKLAIYASEKSAAMRKRATAELPIRIEKISKERTTETGLLRLTRYRQTNDGLYANLDEASRQHLDSVVANRIRTMTADIVADLIADVRSVPEKADYLKRLATIYSTSIERLENSISGADLQPFTAEVVALRTAFITKNQTQIMDEIAATKLESAIDALGSSYLEIVDRSNPIVQAVEMALTSRRNDIARARESNADLALTNFKLMHEPDLARLAKRRSSNDLRWARLQRTTALIYPTTSDLSKISRAVVAIGNRAPEADITSLILHIRGLAFRPYSDEFYSDHNSYHNVSGHRLESWRQRDGQSAVVVLTIENPPEAVLEIYSEHFVCDLRSTDSATKSDALGGRAFVTGKLDYRVADGSAIFLYDYDGKRLEITCYDNRRKGIPVPAEQIGPNTYRITPWVRYIPLRMKANQRMRLTAIGRMSNNGVEWMPKGVSTPFALFNAAIATASVDGRLPYSALIARVSDGPWFLVGGETEHDVSVGGLLYIQVNRQDTDMLNSDGYFDVTVESW